MGYFGDTNVPSGSVAPHLMASLEGSTINDNSTAVNMAASANVTIAAATVGASVSVIRVGNINTPNSAGVNFNTSSDYIYSAYTLNSNSTILRLDRIGINTVSGGSGANFRAKVTVYDTSTSTETVVLAEGLFNSTSGTIINFTSPYDLQPGKTYQLRIYLSKGSASSANPLTLDIDNPVFRGFAIPDVKTTSLVIPCDNTTVSTTALNATVHGVTPAGFELRWFRGGTQFTGSAAGPGTYTPYYYDTTNSCYHPAGSSVIVSLPVALCCTFKENALTGSPFPTSGTTAPGWTIAGTNTVTFSTNGLSFPQNGSNSGNTTVSQTITGKTVSTITLQGVWWYNNYSNATRTKTITVSYAGVDYLTITTGDLTNTAPTIIPLNGASVAGTLPSLTSGTNSSADKQDITIYLPSPIITGGNLLMTAVSNNGPLVVDGISLTGVYVEVCKTCVAGSTAPVFSDATNYSAINAAYSIACGSSTADLSALTATNQPAGTSVTWHTAATATNANKVSPVTAVAGTTKLYAAFYDTGAGCYSPTQAVTVYAPICAANDNYTSTPITAGVGGTLPSIFGNDTYNGTTISTLPAYTVQLLYELWTPANAIVDVAGDGTLTIPASVPVGTYTYTYKICDNSANATPGGSCKLADVTFVVKAPCNAGTAQVPLSGSTKSN
ncbi:hypothetical protein AC804_07045 [Chryseobacterium sp. Hurlbut01]|nr:hypothetical protein AC804_07045 [Chryseobacterium sp. Hurlbut01]